MKRVYVRDVPIARRFRHFAKWYTKTGTEDYNGIPFVTAINDLDLTTMVFSNDILVVMEEKDEFITVSR